MEFHSDRRFRLWDCRVSHKQVLLRSPQTPELETNVDVVLWGVEYLDLATTLDGLAIVPAGAEEIERAGRALDGPVDASRVYCFASGGRRFLVVAAGLKVLRNDLDIFESSLEYFQATDRARDLGEVLAHS